MQSQRLHISLGIPSPVNDNETANGHGFNLTAELFVLKVHVLIVVPVHDQSFERVLAIGVQDAICQPRQQKSDPILANSVDAFNVRTVLSLISDEYCRSCADNLQLM